MYGLMATAAEQWVLVEMVQALYEVSSAAQRPTTTPDPGEGGRLVRICGPGAWAGLPRSRPGPPRP